MSEHPQQMAAWKPLEEAIQIRWQDQVRVSSFLADMENNHVALAFQPVHLVDGPKSHIFYHEALTRKEQDGRWHSCCEEIRAMERLGHIAWFDFQVMNSVMNLLGKQHDICIGCNVSACTMRLNIGWHDIFERLKENPGAASRLVIEITETAPLPDREEALLIVQTLHFLGCKVVIDDMGSGYLSLPFVRDCKPDAIKLDQSVLSPNSGSTAVSAELLLDMVGLCTHLSSCIIVEGVENEELLKFSTQAGVNGVQGMFIGEPDIHPCWLGSKVYLSGSHPYANLFDMESGKNEEDLWFL